MERRVTKDAVSRIFTVNVVNLYSGAGYSDVQGILACRRGPEIVSSVGRDVNGDCITTTKIAVDGVRARCIMPPPAVRDHCRTHNAKIQSKH